MTLNGRRDGVVLNDEIRIGLIGLGQELLHEDLLGAELVAPVDERRLLGVAEQMQRLFDRRVAAADGDHFLVPEERGRRRCRSS